MNKQTTLFFGAALLVMVLLSACGPQLAKTPYGATEQRWEEFVQTNYPEWEAPQTIPPVTTMDDDMSRNDSDDFPEFIADDNNILGETVALDESDIEGLPESGDIQLTPESQTYVVQKGDSLWRIAKQFYGSGTEWRKILEANKDIISDPNRIRPGTELVIPAP